MKKCFQIVGWIIALLIVGYMVIAWTVFQWINPTANNMSFYRDFVSVMKMDTLEKYQ